VEWAVVIGVAYETAVAIGGFFAVIGVFSSRANLASAT